MNDVKKAYAWQEAIKLSKQLMTVCEEFSDADTNVLVWHLRQAVVDVPAAIAVDLQLDRAASMEPVVRLATTLELVRRIYPGIETGSAETKLERLMQRMSGEGFGEREPEPEPEDDADADTETEANTETEAEPETEAKAKE